MQKSTAALAIVSAVMLGYIVGIGRSGNTVSAGPSEVNMSGTWFSTSADGLSATVWSLDQGRNVSGARRYVVNGSTITAYMYAAPVAATDPIKVDKPK